MFDDQTWKALYRSYLTCLFFTGAAFEAYLVYHVGYAPSTMSAITRVAIPAAVISVPIVALFVMPTLIFLTLAKNEGDFKKLGVYASSLWQEWESLFSRQSGMPASSKWATIRTKLWEGIKLLIKTIIPIASVIYIVLAFAFSSYGILLSLGVHFSINPTSPAQTWIILALVTVILLTVYYVSILSVTQNKNTVFSIVSILFFLLVGCVEYHWMPAFLASDGLATDGYGKIYLVANKSFPLFSGVSCKPYYLQLGPHSYRLAYAKLEYSGTSENVLNYTGYRGNSAANPIKKLVSYSQENMPPLRNSALCVGSVHVSSSMVLFHSSDTGGSIGQLYAEKDITGYKTAIKTLLANMSKQ